MATENECKDVAPVSDYSIRAAAAVNLLVPGPHKDKRIARLFGVSVRFAKYLRQGQHWTLDRLSQASRLLGSDFDIALFHVEANRLRQTQAELLQHLRGDVGETHKGIGRDGTDPAGDGGDVAGG